MKWILLYNIQYNFKSIEIPMNQGSILVNLNRLNWIWVDEIIKNRYISTNDVIKWKQF